MKFVVLRGVTILSGPLYETCHLGLLETARVFYRADVELCVLRRVAIVSRRPCSSYQLRPLETAHGLCGADVELCVFGYMSNVTSDFGDCVGDWEWGGASEEGVGES